MTTEKKSKMTPGPWLVSNDVDEAGTFNVQTESGPTYGLVAQVVSRTLFKADVLEAEANARAIAALPQLIEAARAVETQWQKWELDLRSKEARAMNTLRAILDRIDGAK